MNIIIIILLALAGIIALLLIIALFIKKELFPGVSPRALCQAVDTSYYWIENK